MAKNKFEDKIADPFKEIAFSLRGEENSVDDLWEEKPVDIREFIESKKFLNLKWNGRSGCRPKILEIAQALTQNNVKEAVLLLGKGSGKGFISSIIHLYGIYRCMCMYSPQKYYGLSPGSPIYFVNTARNDMQAKSVFFSEFRGHLNNCPWFQNKYVPPSANSVRFLKNVSALSANSQAFSWLGFNVIQWVGDELAFFLTNDNDEESESRAQECWEAAFGSCTTRFPNDYKMIGITTPRYDDDFVMKKFHELSNRDDGYTIQAATWDINPLLTKAHFKHDLERDFRRTMRDFGAVPSGVIESFFPDPEYVENNVCEKCRQCKIYQNRAISTDNYKCWDYDDCNVNAYMGNGEFREWFKPNAEKEYFMHFDLSINKDRTAFTLAHIEDYIEVEIDLRDVEGREEGEEVKDEERFVERPYIKIDFVGFISPASKRDPVLTKNGEIYYDGIYKHIIRKIIDMGFNLVKVTFDQFQSLNMRQKLEDDGIDVELLSLDRTDEVPVTSKYAIVENRVEYPYDKILCREAKHLKYVKGKKVDHTRKESKDLIDSFFGAVYNCEVSDDGSGTFEGLD